MTLFSKIKEGVGVFCKSLFQKKFQKKIFVILKMTYILYNNVLVDFLLKIIKNSKNKFILFGNLKYLY